MGRDICKVEECRSEYLEDLAYPYVDETDNEAYRAFSGSEVAGRTAARASSEGLSAL